MNFAYVSFVNYNENYIKLMKTTIDSVKEFSSYPLILYCIDFPLDIDIHTIFDNLTSQIIIRYINNINLPVIFYYKPYIILDAIKNGLNYGYYIESDDVLTPFADSILLKAAKKLHNYPISPIHPVDAKIPDANCQILNITKKTNHYIHAHVLFANTNLNFIEEWLQSCFKATTFENADETVLNLLYWKYELRNHHLDLIDPWYENFYTNPPTRNLVCSYHGCKDYNIQSKLLQDMKQYYL